jgi:hypothetical protein
MAQLPTSTNITIPTKTIILTSITYYNNVTTAYLVGYKKNRPGAVLHNKSENFS